jgi:aspartate racemase
LGDALEKDLVYGRPHEVHRSILESSVRTLAKAGASKIAIPCNTVHVFIDGLRKISEVPVFSIIDETAQSASRMGFRKVGVLASSTSIGARLYQNGLSRYGIEPICPDADSQGKVCALISRILEGSRIDASREEVREIILEMEAKGAEAIILGCTDLRLAGLDSAIPFIDSATALEDAAVRFLCDER